MLARFNTIYW